MDSAVVAIIRGWGKNDLENSTLNIYLLDLISDLKLKTKPNINSKTKSILAFQTA